LIFALPRILNLLVSHSRYFQHGGRCLRALPITKIIFTHDSLIEILELITIANGEHVIVAKKAPSWSEPQRQYETEHQRLEPLEIG
jgi:hypothetical protein